MGVTTGKNSSGKLNGAWSAGQVNLYCCHGHRMLLRSESSEIKEQALEKSCKLTI